MSNQLDYEAIRDRAEKRVKARAEFMTHLFWYVATNLFLWIIWAVTKWTEFPWPALVTFGWGIGLVAHFMDYYGKTTMMDNMRERAIRQEMEREMRMRGISGPLPDEEFEKPKRDRAMRLSDDGEIIPADEDDRSQRSSRRKS